MVAGVVLMGGWAQAQQEPERWQGLVVAAEDANCPAYRSSHYSYYASGRGSTENWLERHTLLPVSAHRSGSPFSRLTPVR